MIDKECLSFQPNVPKIPTNFLRLTRPSSNINASYLNYYLNYFYKSGEVTKYQAGSNNLRNLKFKDYIGIDIPLPPRKEQHRIVAKIEELFSELDKGIESLKRAREQLKVYRQALLKHAFEGKLTEQWRKDNADKLETADQLLARIKQAREDRHQHQQEEWKTAVEQWKSDEQRGKTPTKPKPLKEFPTITETELENLPDIPKRWSWLRLGNLFRESPQNGVYKPSSEYGRGSYIVRIDDFYDGKLIRSKGFKRLNLSNEELEKYLLSSGDILINRVNSIEYLGKCCEVKHLAEPAVFESNIMKLKMHESILLGDYLTTSFASFEGRNRLCSNAKHAVNQASINQTDVSMTPIPICSIREQQKIIESLDSQLSVISSMIEDVDKNLLRSEALRQSILKKAFSGQLVDQDPSDEPASILLERIAAEKAQAATQRKKPRASKKNPAMKKAG